MAGPPRPCAMRASIAALLLVACGAHERAATDESTAFDAAQTAQTNGHDASSEARDARSDTEKADAATVVHVTQPACGVPQLTESGDLPAACADAAVRADASTLDAGTLDANTPLDALAGGDADACGANCAAEAAMPEAALPEAGLFGPCAELKNDCSLAYFEVQLPATCSLSKFLGADTLSVRYQACEVCNKAGWINQHMVRIKDCDGCEQIYAEGAGASYRTSGKGCRDFSWSNVSLSNSAADLSCIDVYAAVGSATDGNVTDGLHSVRVCRCNRQTGSCVRCNSTGCESM